MKTSAQLPEGSGQLPEGREFNPTTSLEAPFHWLVQAGDHLLLGLLLGYIAARAMRAFGLRWTWAALVAGLIGLIPGLLGPAGWPAGIAAAYAAYRGCRAEHVDVLANGASLQGPLHAFRALQSRMALRWRMRSGGKSGS